MYAHFSVGLIFLSHNSWSSARQLSQTFTWGDGPLWNESILPGLAPRRASSTFYQGAQLKEEQLSFLYVSVPQIDRLTIRRPVGVKSVFLFFCFSVFFPPVNFSPLSQVASVAFLPSGLLLSDFRSCQLGVLASAGAATGFIELGYPDAAPRPHPTLLRGLENEGPQQQSFFQRGLRFDKGVMACCTSMPKSKMIPITSVPRFVSNLGRSNRHELPLQRDHQLPQAGSCLVQACHLDVNRLRR